MRRSTEFQPVRDRTWLGQSAWTACVPFARAGDMVPAFRRAPFGNRCDAVNRLVRSKRPKFQENYAMLTDATGRNATLELISLVTLPTCFFDFTTVQSPRNSMMLTRKPGRFSQAKKVIFRYLGCTPK